MGLEVLLLLKGRWEPEELGLPDTMACNIRGKETLIVPFPLHAPRYPPCDLPPLEYGVPPGLCGREFEIILSDWESGCLEEGRAVVLCGWKGERLRPEYMRKDPLPCQENGLFYTEGHVRVTALPSGELLLEGFTPLLERRRIAVKREVLWKGSLPLPEGLGRFEEAAKAALEKARCPGCRELHYASIG
jgi:hypothetical protein